MTAFRHCLLLALVASYASAYQLPLQQPGSSDPKDVPYRPLPWGDINILHTTDTHGWLGGHAAAGSEASFSGDWGDLYSFATRMKQEAARKGVDLLLVDSGDRVDGNGLVDAEPPPAVKGSSALRVWREMPYDVVTTGNHELYRSETAKMTKELVADHYGDRYVTSNVELNGTGPLGQRVRKFKTLQGRNVTAFGILFNFRAHAPDIQVQAPSDMVKDKWFLDAIQERPDFFLLVGHMSIRLGDSEWTQVVQAIRKLHPSTPVLIFGGHHHIRDCVQEDKYSMSLASGRYMETVGFMSVSNLTSGTPHFQRRYIDQNRGSYVYHVGENFDTRKGRQISRDVSELSAAFNLTLTYGFAPHSYFLSRHAHTSPQSVFRLMTRDVLPVLVNRTDRPNRHMVILNTGSIRFDVYKGPFTRNSQWNMLPFANNFLFVKDVPLYTAKRMLTYLNIVGEHGLAQALDSELSQDELRARDDADVELAYRTSLADANQTFKSALVSKDLSMGYVTKDACPGSGDDTLHRPFPYVPQPIFVATPLAPNRPAKRAIQSRRKAMDESELLDVVFLDFIKPDILNALNVLQHEKVYTPDDVDRYVDSVSANTLMQQYATKYWN